MGAYRRQEIENITSIHELEQNDLSVERRSDFENHLAKPCVSVVGRILLEPLKPGGCEIEAVTVRNAVAKMLYELQYGRTVEVTMLLQRVAERE